jgi:hypothetical protein
VTNPVNTSIVGAYTVTYRVRDSAGNGIEATRSVQVAAREGVGGGGGGALEPLAVLLLAVALLARWRARAFLSGTRVARAARNPRTARTA